MASFLLRGARCFFVEGFISVVPCLVHDLFTKLIEVFKLFSFIQNYRFTYKHIPQSSIFVLKVTSVYYYSYRVNLFFSFKFTDFFDLFIYFALLRNFSSSRSSDIIKIGEWKSKIFFYVYAINDRNMHLKITKIMSSLKFKTWHFWKSTTNIKKYPTFSQIQKHRERISQKLCTISQKLCTRWEWTFSRIVFLFEILIYVILSHLHDCTFNVRFYFTDSSVY